MKNYLDVILLFFLISITLTYPLIMKMYDIPNVKNGWDTDAPKYIFYIYYFKQSILQKRFPIPITKHFYPDGIKPGYDGFPIPYCVFGALIALLTNMNEIMIHNLLCIISLTFSGFSIYILINEFLRNRIASIIGGIVYMSSPYVLGEIVIGHTNLMLLMWIPLVLLFFHKIIESPNRLRYSILFGLFLGLQIISSEQYFVYLSIILSIYSFFKFRRILKLKKQFIKSVAISIITFLLVSGWYISYFVKEDKVKRTFWENRRKAFTINSLQDLQYIQKYPVLFFSFVGMILILCLKKREFYPFIFIGIFTSLCSLGPFNQYAPYSILFKYWPFINAFRVPLRIVVFVLLSISIFSSYLSLLILKEIKSIQRCVFLITVLLFLSIYNRPSAFNKIDYFSQKEDNRLYREISLKNSNFSIIEYPNTYSCIYSYNVILHEKNLIGGCSSITPKNWNKFVGICHEDILNIEDENCKSLMKKYNVKYVFFHSEKYHHYNWTKLEKKFNSSKELRFVDKEGYTYLYEILI